MTVGRRALRAKKKSKYYSLPSNFSLNLDYNQPDIHRGTVPTNQQTTTQIKFLALCPSLETGFPFVQICIISKAGITFGAQGICNHPSSGKSAGMITFQICASVKYSQMNFSWSTLSLPNLSTFSQNRWSIKICSFDISWSDLPLLLNLGCLGIIRWCLWHGSHTKK